MIGSRTRPPNRAKALTAIVGAIFALAALSGIIAPSVTAASADGGSDPSCSSCHNFG